MNDKKKIEIIINNYIKNLSENLTEVWNNWNKDVINSEEYEVIGGLLSRQVSLSIELAKNMSLWNWNIGPIILRCMIDNYINFSWILVEPLERSRKFIFFGLGQEKLQLEHRKSIEEDSEEKRIFISVIEDWINSQNYTFLTEVSFSNWSELSVREMAEQTNNLELYNFVYQPFSSCVHNTWNHIAKFNLKQSDNPLHMFSRIPVINIFNPDIKVFELSTKYTDMMFSAFSEKYRVILKGLSAKENFDNDIDDFIESLNKDK